MRLDFVGCELFDIPYFRRAVRVMVHLIMRRVVEGVQVRDCGVPEPGCASYQVVWES